jgi:uncharacterized protein YjbJ (UPF0337 family)
MNRDRLVGRWKQVKGSAREKWGNLTDADLEIVAGKKDKLVGMLQERYGIVKEEAIRQSDEWIKALRAARRRAAHTLRRRTSAIRKSVTRS